MSRPRSRTRKEFPQISSVSSLLENSWRMEELFLTTTSRRNQLSILSSGFVEVCKSLSRPSLGRPSLLRLSLLTPLRMSRPRSRTRKEFPQINSVSSLLENSWRTEELFLTTTSRKNPLSILSSDFVEVCKSLSRPSP